MPPSTLTAATALRRQSGNAAYLAAMISVLTAAVTIGGTTMVQMNKDNETVRRNVVVDQDMRAAARFLANQATDNGTSFSLPADVGGDLPNGLPIARKDPYGRAYTYCLPSAPATGSNDAALAIVSGGGNKAVQTSCGQALANAPAGDDKVVMLTKADVAAARNAAGSAGGGGPALDASSQITVAKVTVGSAPAGDANTQITVEKDVLVGGNVSAGSIVAVGGISGSSASIGGTLSVTDINASGTVTAGALSLTTPLAIASGGTGAATADGALGNLGGASVGISLFKSADQTAARTALGISGYGATLASAADAASARSTLGISNYGATLAAAADAAAARGTLGLGDLAQQNGGSLSVSLVPSSDNTVALGSSVKRFSNVYAASITGNLTGNVTGNASTATSASTAASATTAGNVTGIVAVANGGTGANTAANARTNLGLGNVSTLSTNASTSQFLRGDGTWQTPTGGLPVDGRNNFLAGVTGARTTTDNDKLLYLPGYPGQPTAQPWTSYTSQGLYAVALDTTGKHLWFNPMFSYWYDVVPDGYKISYGRVSIDRYDTAHKWTGNYGVTIGVSALGGKASSSDKITAVGYYAGYNCTACGNSVIIGDYAGQGDSGGFSGSSNVVVGSYAMQRATTAYTNVAIGSFAGQYITSGYYNVVIGQNDFSSGYQISTGHSNVVLGYSAGSEPTGNYNTSVGRSANAMGNNSTAVGAYSATGTGFTNQVAIGYQASANANNTVVLGNSSIQYLRAAVTSISSLSDARLKTDVANLDAGLGFIRQLRPVSYHWTDHPDRRDQWGFIAQEVEALAPADRVTLVDIDNDGMQTRTLRYSNLIAPTVKAVQELADDVDSLKSKLECQQREIEELKAALRKLQMPN